MPMSKRKQPVNFADIIRRVIVQHCAWARKSVSTYGSINLTTGGQVGGELTRDFALTCRLGHPRKSTLTAEHKHDPVDVAGLLTPTIIPPGARRDLQGELVKPCNLRPSPLPRTPRTHPLLPSAKV